MGGRGEAEQQGYLFPHLDCIRKLELLWLIEECASTFCSLMAHMKKTARPIDSLEVADSASDATVSFEFGLSRVTSSNLDEFVKAGWFGRDLVRPSEGEVVLDPRDDEVVVYK